MRILLRALLAAGGLLAGGSPETVAAQVPAADTAALSARYYNPTQPDTARVRAGLQLVQGLGTDTLALRRRWALATALLTQARRLHHASLTSSVLSELELLAGQTNRPADQLRYARQQLALAQQQHDTTALVHAHDVLSSSYFDAQNMPEARRYAEQADRLMHRHPVPAKVEAVLLSHLTNIYLELKQPALARQAFRRALPAVRRVGQPLYEFNLLATYGNGLRLAQPDSALPYLHRALALAQALGNPYALAYAHLLLMQTHKPLKDWLRVRDEARITLRYARLSGTPDYEAEALAGLAESLRYFGHGTAAYDTLRLAQTLLNTLQAAANQQELNALQVQAGTARQQAQIRALQQDRLLAIQQQELTRLLAQRQQAGGVALLLLLLTGAGGLLWQYRRRQASREAALRTQLAADLHDDVGTLLSQISLQSGVLQAGLADASGHRQQLSQIAEASRTAVRQLNDVVWSLDAHNDTLPQLLDRLRDYAYEVLTPAGLAVAFDAPATLPAGPLPTAVRRNLYLIYKEALHNVLKHAAGATQVTVRLALAASPAALLLDVADDAPAPLPPPTPARRSGHGLRNMTTRAAALGGSATSAAGVRGFTVRVRLPLGD